MSNQMIVEKDEMRRDFAMTINAAATAAERTNTVTVQTFNDALNNRDRQAVKAAFAEDGCFRPGGAGQSFDGPEAATERLFSFLDKHTSGQFETLRAFAAGDEVFSEWRWTGTTTDGNTVESHGADYFLLRDGQIVVKSTFLKV